MKTFQFTVNNNINEEEEMKIRKNTDKQNNKQVNNKNNEHTRSWYHATKRKNTNYKKKKPLQTKFPKL